MFEKSIIVIARSSVSSEKREMRVRKRLERRRTRVGEGQDHIEALTRL